MHRKPIDLPAFVLLNHFGFCKILHLKILEASRWSLLNNQDPSTPRYVLITNLSNLVKLNQNFVLFLNLNCLSLNTVYCILMNCWTMLIFFFNFWCSIYVCCHYRLNSFAFISDLNIHSVCFAFVSLQQSVFETKLLAQKTGKRILGEIQNTVTSNKPVNVSIFWNLTIMSAKFNVMH